MPVKLVFLGRLEDVAGGASRQGAPGPLADLVAGFEPELARAVSAARIRIALNGQLLADGGGLVLDDGDEVAFLPPVSGG
jgi:molybdopterin synthase sulfur carrier subunit